LVQDFSCEAVKVTLDKPTKPLPRDISCSVHTERAGHFCDGFAGGDPLNCLLPLVRGKLLRPPEAHASHLGALPALTGSGPDQGALELGEPAPGWRA
jgi:hypothetical protein